MCNGGIRNEDVVESIKQCGEICSKEERTGQVTDKKHELSGQIDQGKMVNERMAGGRVMKHFIKQIDDDVETRRYSELKRMA